MTIIKLFLEFLKIGMFSVGGGMATLPFLYDLGERTGWFTSQQIADMLAVSESTPGPIGINMGTYVGYTVGGFAGSLAATIATVIPGAALVIIITAIIEKFRNNKYVNGAFYGLRPASTALITAAGLLVARTTFLNLDLFSSTGKMIDLISVPAIVLAGVLLIFTRYIKKTKKLHPIVFIAASAVVGIVFHFGGV